MGLQAKGTISKGKDVDLVVFDEDINVKRVIARGNMIEIE